MRLSFPNPSRSFDQSNKRIRFWGYDRTVEVSFFVETDALKRFSPNITDIESEFLQAFDSARNKICEVANKVYERDGKGSYSYVLAAKDFK